MAIEGVLEMLEMKPPSAERNIDHRPCPTKNQNNVIIAIWVPLTVRGTTSAKSSSEVGSSWDCGGTCGTLGSAQTWSVVFGWYLDGIWMLEMLEVWTGRAAFFFTNAICFPTWCPINFHLFGSCNWPRFDLAAYRSWILPALIIANFAKCVNHWAAPPPKRKIREHGIVWLIYGNMI